MSNSRIAALSVTMAVIAACGPSLETPTVAPDPVGVASVRVVGDVMPSAETIRYVGNARWIDADGGIEALPTDDLVATIAPQPKGRTVAVQATSGISNHLPVDGNGMIDSDYAHAREGSDVLDHLPPAGTELQLGTTFTSDPPPMAWIQANDAAGSLTLSPIVHNEVVGLWSVGRYDVVRVATRTVSHLYALDDGYDGESTLPRDVELGVISLGAADLLHDPDHGWRMIRLTRLTPTAEDVDTGSLALSDVRELPRVEFTACATDSDRLPQPVLALVPAYGDVPEFSACTPSLDLVPAAGL